MNNNSLQILELIEEAQYIKAFPLLSQLRTELQLNEYLELLNKMIGEGYRLFALYEGNQIKSLIGLSIRTNFYNKSHLYIHDLVSDTIERSKGYGQQLLQYIHQWAKDQGLEYVALESGLQRTEAHRFYEEKMEYDKWCYSFRKKL
jgi:GNAT superfamily N-acetyltransferase